jgi:DNA-binding transcriptional LysR family regulator
MPRNAESLPDGKTTMTITLLRLRSFVAVAETRNFDKAAKVVGRSQPAITEHIKTLEQTLGVALFHRQTRSVRLTSEGEVFQRRIVGFLRDLDGLLSDFSRVVALDNGEVRVGASPTLACYIFPEIIGSFRKRFPGITVHFSDESAAALEKMVEDQDLDFYFGPRPSNKSKLKFQVVAEDDYVIVAPRGHPLTKSGCNNVKVLAHHPLLLLRGGTNVRFEIDRFFQRHRLKIKPVAEVSNHFTLGGLVETGCGLTLLPRSAHAVIAHPGTAIVEIPDPKFVRVLGVATRTDFKSSPAAKAFLSIMIPLVIELLNGRKSMGKRR